MNVFVSSTFEDLRHHPRAVREVILRLGHYPIGMEDFRSQPIEPKVAALEAVANCDALVGIYAYRYGTIRQNETRSITDLEL